MCVCGGGVLEVCGTLCVHCVWKKVCACACVCVCSVMFQENYQCS